MNNRVPVLIAFVLGAGLLAGSGYFFFDTRQLLSIAAKTPGVVVGFERRSSKGGSTDYAIIEFATPSGEMHRFTTSGPGGYTRGTTVEVLYEAANPAHVRVNAFLELWLSCLALGAFGLLCLGAGLGTWLSGRGKNECASNPYNNAD